MTTSVGKADNAPAMSDKRAAILRAADELLSEQGLDGLTVRAVLARTSLARRAFYDIFGTKDDLVLAAFENTLAEAAARLAAEGAVLPGPAQRLALVIHSIVVAGSGTQTQDFDSVDRRSAAFSREHLRLAQIRPAELQRAIEPLVELIRNIVMEGMELGQWQSPAPERSARFVYNLVSTTVHTELLDPSSQRLSPEERFALAGQLTTFCLRALAA